MHGGNSMMLLASAELTSSFLPLALVLCAVTVSLLLLRRRLRDRVDPRASGQEMLERFRRQARVADSLDGMAIQLEELARRVSAQVDTRFAKLEAVIRDADERIARLETLLARTAGSAVAEPDSPRPQPPPAGPRPTSRPRRARADAPPAAARISELHRRVFELRNRGRNPGEIARELGLSLGEVEVILELPNNGP